MAAKGANGGRTDLGTLLAGPHERLLHALGARLASAGFPEVRPAHGVVFRLLDDAGTRVTELARRAGMTKQAMTELVVHLEAAGCIERTPDPADRRAKLARLTARGRAARDATRTILTQIEAEWEAEVGAKRMRRLRRGLAILNARPAAEQGAGVPEQG